MSNIADTMLSSRLLIRWNVRANLTSKQLLYKVGIPSVAALVLSIIAWRLGGPGSGATQWMPYLVVWTAVVLSVFHIGARPLIGISLMLILAGAIALATGNKPLAERLGEAAFYFLAMGVVYFFVEMVLLKRTGENGERASLNSGAPGHDGELHQ